MFEQNFLMECMNDIIQPNPETEFFFLTKKKKKRKELNDPDSRSSINTHSPSGALERINVLGVPPNNNNNRWWGTSKKEFRDRREKFFFCFQIESEDDVGGAGFLFFFFFSFFLLSSPYLSSLKLKKNRCR